MKIRESKLAHKYLDNMIGIEIGGSAHNTFGLNTINVDYTASLDTVFKRYEIEICGKAMPVDLVARGDDLPLKDRSIDFVVSAHVLEHFLDPIKALKEWYRVIREGGHIFAIVPHKERTFDRDTPRTTLKELIERHGKSAEEIDLHKHYSFWITEDLVDLISFLGWNLVRCQDIDDKVGNGFTVVIQKSTQREWHNSLVRKNILRLQLSSVGKILSFSYFRFSRAFARMTKEKILLSGEEMK